VKRSILLLLAVVLPFQLVIPMNASAHRGRRVDIVYRITEAPEYFFPGPDEPCCYTGTVEIENLRGSPIGTTTLHVSVPPEERMGPPYQFIETGTLSVELPRGELIFDVTFVDTYNADRTAVAHFARGVLTDATGVYRGTEGNLRGAGIALFDADGTASPFLTYHVRLTP
jgi:hypothetical protein